jgi:hypothetical protein
MYLQPQETYPLKDIKVIKSILSVLNIMRGLFNNSFSFQPKDVFCIEIKSVHQEIFLQESHDWRHNETSVRNMMNFHFTGWQ